MRVKCPIIPHFYIIVKETKKMTDDLPTRRQMIALAADQCTDPDLLDLVYKLLIAL